MESVEGSTATQHRAVVASAAVPFSNDGSDIIQQRVEAPANVKATPRSTLAQVYEVDRCADFINTSNKQRVALQFPDELLGDSVAVAEALRGMTSALVFILADTSYGSCCVDEVAAEHGNADLIIHYGRSCLSKPSRLPVLFVFGRAEIDVEHGSECFAKYIRSNGAEKDYLLLFDVVYAHAIDALSERLKEFPGLVVSALKPYDEATKNAAAETQVASGSAESSSSSSPLEAINKLGRSFQLRAGSSLADYTVLFVGSESRTLTNLMMVFNKCPFFRFDPATNSAQPETLNVSRALMKRYFLIQKAKEANTVGIIAGTLGVADYQSAISQLKQMCQRAGKKVYLFVMGKLNVAKLANFAEIDIYTLVACPENSMIDATDFYRPVVTPYELEIACIKSASWTGDYETDFRAILPALFKANQEKAEDDEDEEPEYSLITGSYKQRFTASDNSTEGKSDSTGALVTRNTQTAIAQLPAAQHLASRTFRGLEQRLGETEVTKAVEGRSGIAAGYAEEPK